MSSGSLQVAEFDVGRGWTIPAREITIEFARSSGAGGQNVNKVSTKAILRWQIVGSEALPPPVLQRFRKAFANRISGEGTLLITCEEHRQQRRNLEKCYAKLVEMIDSVAVPPKPRKKTRPKRSAVEGRLREKRAQSEKKADRRYKD